MAARRPSSRAQAVQEGLDRRTPRRSCRPIGRLRRPSIPVSTAPARSSPPAWCRGRIRESGGVRHQGRRRLVPGRRWRCPPRRARGRRRRRSAVTSSPSRSSSSSSQPGRATCGPVQPGTRPRAAPRRAREGEFGSMRCHREAGTRMPAGGARSIRAGRGRCLRWPARLPARSLSGSSAPKISRTLPARRSR